jgi:uncharacterized protein (DUF2147 family)
MLISAMTHEEALVKHLLFALAFILAASPAYALSGRWITQSGNLEIEIAPCGDALCGTAVKVLANHSMSNPGSEMTNAAAPALGLQVLRDFVPVKDNQWSGHLFDRENGKTYRCRLTLLDSGDLEVHPYIGLPLFGQTQIWRRAFD